ncbi:MAG: hypothetical protein K2X69_16250, partial [Silvanigrellaceae bacterium]|nr:hypothetical protein [Silvanigrellaceae bacterium]
LKEMDEKDRENILILGSTDSEKTGLKKLNFKEFIDIQENDKKKKDEILELERKKENIIKQNNDEHEETLEDKKVLENKKENNIKIDKSEIILKIKYDKNHVILNWNKRIQRKNYTYEIFKSSYEDDNYQLIEKNYQNHIYEDHSIKDGMSYYYRIIGYDKDKNKIESNIETIHTKPTSIENLNAKLENNKVILKWGIAKSNLPVTYEVKRSLHSNKGYYSLKKGLTNLFFEDETTKPGEKYFYIIKAFDTKDNFSISNEVYINTSPNKIELKGYLKNEYIYLEWKDGQSRIPIQYDVMRSNSLNGKFNPIASNLKMKFYRDRSIENANTYFYQIIGKNEDGIKIYSNIFSTKTSHSKITLSVTYENPEVHLKWNKNLGNIPLKYSVQRSLNNFKDYDVINENTNISEFIDKSPLNGFQYFYKITAEDENNIKVESNIVHILTKSNSVDNIQLILNEKYNVEIQWNKIVTNSKYLYTIKRSYEFDKNFEVIAKNLKDNYFVDKKAKPGNEIFYIISAVNNENMEVDSDIHSIITTPKEPIFFNLSLKNNSIFLNWQKIDSNLEIKYEIFRSEFPNKDEFILLDDSVIKNEYEDKSILPEEKY